jgi:RNA polymerase sigma-70 factor (ECF subfamily)
MTGATMIETGADGAVLRRRESALAGSAPRAVTALVAGHEDHLVAAAVQGDSASFAALYDLHVDRVYRYCYYRTGNRPDAEDLAQQTFMHAWRAIRRYRPGGAPFIAWLLAISHNVSASHFRRPRDVVTHESPESAPSTWGDPEAALAEAIVRQEVRTALSRLRPEQQRVILLRFVAGFSASEVAAALGTTDNNVRVIQHRALTRLRSLLGDQGANRPAGQSRLLARLRRTVSSAMERVTEAAQRP